MTNIDPGKVPSASGSPQILRVVFAENGVSVGQGQDTAPYSLQPLIPDTCPDSSLLKQEQQSLVVKAVADSACDHSVRQVEARQREPAENEPTSTVCEETEPAGSACETSDSDSEEAKSVMRQREHSLSQWQPKVSLFRLPVSPARPGCPLPSFRLVHGDSEDEIYLEELSEDSQVELHLSVMMFLTLPNQVIQSRSLVVKIVRIIIIIIMSRWVRMRSESFCSRTSPLVKH